MGYMAKRGGSVGLKKRRHNFEASEPARLRLLRRNKPSDGKTALLSHSSWQAPIKVDLKKPPMGGFDSSWSISRLA
jgi:hypothetical protein